nr:MAG TPA: hypothetical protein [Caudoviricetes sp.]DAR39160.1 MAG TPA: hypothetical protein [Caudoviricetes sp.]
MHSRLHKISKSFNLLLILSSIFYKYIIIFIEEIIR